MAGVVSRTVQDGQVTVTQGQVSSNWYSRTTSFELLLIMYNNRGWKLPRSWVQHWTVASLVRMASGRLARFLHTTCRISRCCTVHMKTTGRDEFHIWIASLRKDGPGPVSRRFLAFYNATTEIICSNCKKKVFIHFPLQDCATEHYFN